MAEEVKVWDLLVRLGHWTLALCVFGALLTRQGGTAHEVFGYAALGIVALRLVWGFVGPPTARFASFVRGLRPTLSYGRAVMARSDARHIGHNPLGAWMIVALLGLAFVAAATGALFVTDAFWGGAWVDETHAVSAYALLAIVPIHVGGVIYASVRHRENLIVTMLHGRKRRP